MNDLTLIIPTKKEVESLPIFLKEIENYNCKKLIVLQKEDIETIKVIEKLPNIKILVQKKNFKKVFKIKMYFRKTFEYIYLNKSF